VFDKHLGNYCEWFEMSRRVFGGKAEPSNREQAARDTLKKLFGD
jgi:hypothetical protein